MDAGVAFLDEVTATLDSFGLPLWFLDGNHEDHDALDALPFDPATGRRPVTDRIDHLPRGYRWQFQPGGTRWAAVGGAPSVDRDHRVPTVSWFEQEQLTDQAADQVIAAGAIDVLLCHDAPWGIEPLRTLYEQHLLPWERRPSWPVSALIDSDAHQQRIRRLVDHTHPALLVHGHHHRSLSALIATNDGSLCHVIGLGDDSGPSPWIIVTTTGSQERTTPDGLH